LSTSSSLEAAVVEPGGIFILLAPQSKNGRLLVAVVVQEAIEQRLGLP
jgi:hypothetical protein